MKNYQFLSIISIKKWSVIDNIGKKNYRFCTPLSSTLWSSTRLHIHQVWTRLHYWRRNCQTQLRYRYNLCDRLLTKYFPFGTVQRFKFLNHTYSIRTQFQKICISMSWQIAGFYLTWHSADKSLKSCKKFHSDRGYFCWSEDVIA